MAAVTEHNTAAGAGEMVQRLCRLAMKMALPGCALVLMPRAESASALARLRAAAFASGRRMHDVAQDVAERRVRFDE